MKAQRERRQNQNDGKTIEFLTSRSIFILLVVRALNHKNTKLASRAKSNLHTD